MTEVTMSHIVNILNVICNCQCENCNDRLIDHAMRSIDRMKIPFGKAYCMGDYLAGRHIEFSFKEQTPYVFGLVRAALEYPQLRGDFGTYWAELVATLAKTFTETTCADYD